MPTQDDHTVIEVAVVYEPHNEDVEPFRASASDCSRLAMAHEVIGLPTDSNSRGHRVPWAANPSETTAWASQIYSADATLRTLRVSGKMLNRIREWGIFLSRCGGYEAY